MRLGGWGVGGERSRVREKKKEEGREEETRRMRRKRAAVTGVVSSLLKHISASLSLGRSEGAGALLSKQQREEEREQRKAQRELFFFSENERCADGWKEREAREREASLFSSFFLCFFSISPARSSSGRG